MYQISVYLSAKTLVFRKEYFSACFQYTCTHRAKYSKGIIWMFAIVWPKYINKKSLIPDLSTYSG
jgi:hypothetical protein